MEAETVKTSNSGKRTYYLDLARALAIISVTLNHALSRSFAVHEGTLEEFMEIPKPLTFLKAVICVFSRLGVPLFLMISGSLLLDRNYEDKAVLKRFIRHNWLGLVITTEIWLAIMYWYLQLSPDSILRTEGILSAFASFIGNQLFINQTTMSSMWYMPMILLLYLMFPVFSVVLKKLENKYIMALIAIVIIRAMLIPNINTALEGLESGTVLEPAFSHTDLFSYFMVYVLVGYWINKGLLKKIKSSTVTIIGIAAFLLTVIFQFWLYSTVSDYGVRYADVGVVIASGCLFEMIRLRAQAFEFMNKPVTYLSKCAFGIYFLHICIMSGLNNVINKIVKAAYLPRFIILEAVAFGLSLIIIWITSKSRLMRKYLYMIK